MSQVICPPIRRFKPFDSLAPTLFLAGSIEMGKAAEWQVEAISRLENCTSVIYNPRRPDWNSDWEQSIDHPEFNAQVNWELDMISKADMSLFYFDPDTQSPITLMELGYAGSFGIHVCCPKGFWRKGNVDIFCERLGIATYDNLDALLTGVEADCQRRINRSMV